MGKRKLTDYTDVRKKLKELTELEALAVRLRESVPVEEQGKLTFAAWILAALTARSVRDAAVLTALEAERASLEAERRDHRGCRVPPVSGRMAPDLHHPAVERQPADSFAPSRRGGQRGGLSRRPAARAMKTTPPSERLKHMARHMAAIVARHSEEDALWIAGYIIGVLHCQLGIDRVWGFLDQLREELSERLPRRGPSQPPGSSDSIH